MTIRYICWRDTHEPVSPLFSSRSDMLRWCIANMPTLREWAQKELENE